MSTRCTITFVEGKNKYTIYQHCDGYPDGPHGVVATVKAVAESGKVWELPRFEADEFAAGYIAVCKTGQGNHRVFNSPKESGDAAFNYTVKQIGRTSQLEVRWGKGDDEFAIVTPEVPRA